MIGALKRLFRRPEPYRLVPDDRGTYTMERYEGLAGYLAVAVNLTPEEADERIRQLDRETLYYREAE